MPVTAKTEHRPLSRIAHEILGDWMREGINKKFKMDKYYAARPYANAMRDLDQISDKFYADTGLDVVLRFLVNAGTWRGDTARRIKAELKDIVRSTGYKL